MNTQTSSVFSDSQTASYSGANVVELRSYSQRAPLPPRVVLSEQDSEWQDSVKQRLEELVDRLPHGWDGYDGRPVGFLNANFALSMLSSICRPSTPAPQIVPGSDGDLQIEWHTQYVDIELAVRGPYDVFAWRCMVDADPDGESLILSRDFTDVAKWIAAISEPPVVANATAA